MSILYLQRTLENDQLCSTQIDYHPHHIYSGHRHLQAVFCQNRTCSSPWWNTDHPWKFAGKEHWKHMNHLFLLYLHIQLLCKKMIQIATIATISSPPFGANPACAGHCSQPAEFKVTSHKWNSEWRYHKIIPRNQNTSHISFAMLRISQFHHINFQLSPCPPCCSSSPPRPRSSPPWPPRPTGPGLPPAAATAPGGGQTWRVPQWSRRWSLRGAAEGVVPGRLWRSCRCHRGNWEMPWWICWSFLEKTWKKQGWGGSISGGSLRRFPCLIMFVCLYVCCILADAHRFHASCRIYSPLRSFEIWWGGKLNHDEGSRHGWGISRIQTSTLQSKWGVLCWPWRERWPQMMTNPDHLKPSVPPCPRVHPLKPPCSFQQCGP